MRCMMGRWGLDQSFSIRWAYDTGPYVALIEVKATACSTVLCCAALCCAVLCCAVLVHGLSSFISIGFLLEAKP
jgi:hypothetical protein